MKLHKIMSKCMKKESLFVRFMTMMTKIQIMKIAKCDKNEDKNFMKKNVQKWNFVNIIN